MRIELKTPNSFTEPVLHDLGGLLLEQRESCTVGAAMRRYAQAQASLREAWQSEHIVTGGSGVPPVAADQTALGDNGQPDFRRCGVCCEMVIPGWRCRCERMQAAQMVAIREARNLTGAPLDGCLYGAAPEPLCSESDAQDVPVHLPDFDIERFLSTLATAAGSLIFAGVCIYLLYLKFTR